MRILGKHPDDDQMISVYSGRYGPYVKHGKTNATIPEKEKADSITLDEAVELLAEKFGAPVKKAAKKVAKKPVKKVAKKVAIDPAEVDVQEAAAAIKTKKATSAKVAAKAAPKAPATRKKKAA
ncbi:MAG: hypothetical protein LH481_13370 [Burkholderiales bacterium]|nr:hypothetical protein [Burkholderiales bacterium]